MKRFTIINKKERWGFTLLGKAVLLLIFILGVFLYMKCIVSFLSPNEPVGADILIVEGFIPDYAIEEALDIFRKGNYSLLIVSGKLRVKGAHLSQYEDDGEFTAAYLLKVGLDQHYIRVVSVTEEVKKDRTYAAALKLKGWLLKNEPQAQSADLVSIGCHSRRSHYIFQKALGDEIKLGIIAVENKGYDPKKWWKFSSGFREVTKETIAWVYARLFFHL